jgi:hypothetical protein
LLGAAKAVQRRFRHFHILISGPRADANAADDLLINDDNTMPIRASAGADIVNLRLNFNAFTW